jgi:membrane protein DedA with SNARE-associated domain
MTLESLIETYGYLALFVGSVLEGETMLVIAGFAAHRGYLDLPWVMLVALAGAMAGDQAWFFLGRGRGRALIAARPRWQQRAVRVQVLLERHPLPVLLGFRFAYGLRIITPLMIGMSGYSPARFFFFNATGAVLWSVIVAGAGYLFGEGLQLILRNVRHYERWVMLLLVVAGACAWSWHLWRSRRNGRAG